MRFFRSILVLIFMTLITLATESSAQEISFWEKFALAEDRGKTLEELVPGSEDYYFFHCLHAQNEGDLDEVDSCLLYTSPSPRDQRGSRMPSSA